MQTDRRAHPRFPLILAVQYLGAETRPRLHREPLRGRPLHPHRSRVRARRAGDARRVVPAPRRAGRDHGGGAAHRPAEGERARRRGGARARGSARGPRAARRDRRARSPARAAPRRAPAHPARRGQRARRDDVHRGAAPALGEADQLPPSASRSRATARPRSSGSCTRRPIDVVVTDVYMPVVSGHHARRADPRRAGARAHSPSIVISLGGRGGARAPRDARRHGLPPQAGELPGDRRRGARHRARPRAQAPRQRDPGWGRAGRG